MYGKGILVEEVNKLISESLTNYIRDEKLNLLGEPLPSENQKTADFDTETEFEFKFDVALAPQVEIKLSKKDKVPYYDIKVDDKLLESHTDNYARKFGEFIDVDETTDNEMLSGNFIQLGEDGSVLESGIKADDVRITIEYIKDADIKATFANYDIYNADDLLWYFALSRREAVDSAVGSIPNSDTNILSEVRLSALIDAPAGDENPYSFLQNSGLV